MALLSETTDKEKKPLKRARRLKNVPCSLLVLKFWKVLSCMQYLELFETKSLFSSVPQRPCQFLPFLRLLVTRRSFFGMRNFGELTGFESKRSFACSFVFRILQFAKRQKIKRAQT